MYKNIIPGLLSFDTELNKLNGSYFGENFSFYPVISKPNLFHYKIIISNKINLPPKYIFKKGYYFKSYGRWYYMRKLSFVNLKFCFDPENRNIYINPLYIHVPFQIGAIVPAGKILSEIINVELFLKGFVLLKGMAVNYKGRIITMLAQSFDGKTTFTNNILEQGGKYIAEDIIVMNINNRTIYPMAPFIHCFDRQINEKLEGNLRGNIITRPMKIKEIYLVRNVTDNDVIKKEMGLFEYFFISSLMSNCHPFVKSYLFEENLIDKYNEVVDRLKNLKLKFINKTLYNYDFSQLFPT